ncbi:13346_t:CDS:2 [Rhizophagus irregularis]|nr:13346_t:CDS:2 [Rhizophagus irregularis]
MSQLINSPTPLIRPPFPPTIDPHDLISPVNTSKDSKDDLSQKKLRTRAPNAFIIYRKVFIETARSQGYYLPMTVISSMASQSWEKENEVVKSEYRRLAREAFNIHCEMLPKSFSPRQELPGLFSWNSRSTTEPCIEHVTFTNPMLSSSNLCSSGLSGSPELSNNILLKEHYNPALKLPPLIPSNNKNHAMHTSLPKLFKPVISR